MQKTGYDALKRMAQMAKNRLRNKVNENDNKYIKNKGNFRILYGSEIDVKSKIITKDDAKLYEKVKSLLDTVPVIVNVLYLVVPLTLVELRTRYVLPLKVPL